MSPSSHVAARFEYAHFFSGSLSQQACEGWCTIAWQNVDSCESFSVTASEKWESSPRENTAHLNCVPINLSEAQSAQTVAYITQMSRCMYVFSVLTVCTDPSAVKIVGKSKQSIVE